MSQLQSPRSWSELPADMLDLIRQKLLNKISDYIRFRSVCKQWRSLANPVADLSQLQQLPLLMLPYDPFTDVRSFYSLSAAKSFSVSLPQLHGKTVLGSSYGWMVLLEVGEFDDGDDDSSKREGELSLVNPFTRGHILLPTTRGFHRRWEEREYQLNGYYTTKSGKARAATSSDNGDRYKLVCPWTVSLSCHPCSSKDDCVVMLSDTLNAYFCRLGDDAWTELCRQRYKRVKGSSIVYHKGLFFVVESDQGLSVFDAVECSRLAVVRWPARVKTPVGLAYVALAKANEEELWLFGQSITVESPEIFKMDMSGRSREWSKLDSLGDKALFWSEKQLLAVTASISPGCPEDCLYFSNDFHGREHDASMEPQSHTIPVFKLKNSRSILLSCGGEGIMHKNMLPIWVTLSLC